MNSQNDDVAKLEALERRVRALEDANAIRNLKARYAAYCDDQYNPDGIASLFAEDAVWENKNHGSYQAAMQSARSSGAPHRSTPSQFTTASMGRSRWTAIRRAPSGTPSCLAFLATAIGPCGGRALIGRSTFEWTASGSSYANHRSRFSLLPSKKAGRRPASSDDLLFDASSRADGLPGHRPGRHLALAWRLRGKRSSMTQYVVFDLETALDLTVARRLLKLSPEIPEEPVRLAIGERYSREGAAPLDVFLKPPLHRIVCLGALFAEREGAGAFTVLRLGARHIGEKSEGDIVRDFAARLPRDDEDKGPVFAPSTRAASTWRRCAIERWRTASRPLGCSGKAARTTGIDSAGTTSISVRHYAVLGPRRGRTSARWPRSWTCPGSSTEWTEPRWRLWRRRAASTRSPRTASAT